MANRGDYDDQAVARDALDYFGYEAEREAGAVRRAGADPRVVLTDGRAQVELGEALYHSLLAEAKEAEAGQKLTPGALRAVRKAAAGRGLVDLVHGLNKLDRLDGLGDGTTLVVRVGVFEGDPVSRQNTDTGRFDRSAAVAGHGGVGSEVLAFFAHDGGVN